jgi:hypothetical protein
MKIQQVFYDAGNYILNALRIRNRPVGIAAGYRVDIPGSILGNARFFSSPQRPHQLWGPPSLLSRGYGW